MCYFKIILVLKPQNRITHLLFSKSNLLSLVGGRIQTAQHVHSQNNSKAIVQYSDNFKKHIFNYSMPIQIDQFKLIIFSKPRMQPDHSQLTSEAIFL